MAINDTQHRHHQIWPSVLRGVEQHCLRHHDGQCTLSWDRDISNNIVRKLEFSKPSLVNKMPSLQTFAVLSLEPEPKRPTRPGTAVKSSIAS